MCTWTLHKEYASYLEVLEKLCYITFRANCIFCAGITFYEGSVRFVFNKFFLCHKSYECCSISHMVELRSELAS